MVPSSRRIVVPCSRLAVRPEKWRTLLGLFDSFRSQFINFWWNALQVQDLSLHEAVDDPVQVRITWWTFQAKVETHQLARAAITTPPTDIDTFRILVAGKVDQGESRSAYLTTRDLLVSMCDLVSPSERPARREPTKTKITILGKTTNVARKNCHNATDWMDYTAAGSVSRARTPHTARTYGKEGIRVHPWREGRCSNEHDQRETLRSLMGQDILH